MAAKLTSFTKMLIIAVLLAIFFVIYISAIELLRQYAKIPRSTFQPVFPILIMIPLGIFFWWAVNKTRPEIKKIPSVQSFEIPKINKEDKIIEDKNAAAGEEAFDGFGILTLSRERVAFVGRIDSGVNIPPIVIETREIAAVRKETPSFLTKWFVYAGKDKLVIVKKNLEERPFLVHNANRWIEKINNIKSV